MSIVTQLPKTNNLLSYSFEAAADLTSYQYCAVVASGSASGTVKITAPTTNGEMSIGILQSYDCDEADRGEIMMDGISQAKVGATFNSGVELTVYDSTGRLAAAGSADYVCAIALQAATAANEFVTVRVIQPYQKNA